MRRYIDGESGNHICVHVNDGPRPLITDGGRALIAILVGKHTTDAFVHLRLHAAEELHAALGQAIKELRDSEALGQAIKKNFERRG